MTIPSVSRFSDERVRLLRSMLALLFERVAVDNRTVALGGAISDIGLRIRLEGVLLVLLVVVVIEVAARRAAVAVLDAVEDVFECIGTKCLTADGLYEEEGTAADRRVVLLD